MRARARLTQAGEELPQQFFALPGQHASADLRPVQRRLPRHVPDAATRPGPGLVGSEDDAANSRPDQRPRTHGAGFQGDHQRAVFQPPGVPELPHSFPDGEDLRVCGGIIVSFAPVHAPPEFSPVRAENHSSDGNVPGGSLRSDVQDAAHQRFRSCIPAGLRQSAAHARLSLSITAYASPAARAWQPTAQLAAQLSPAPLTAQLSLTARAWQPTAQLSCVTHFSPIAHLSWLGTTPRARRALHPHRLELQLHAHHVRQLVGESQLVCHAQNLLRPVQVIVVEDDGHYLLADT